ncbi:MAG: hypothetical protein KGL39_22170 [Patescibacteria group bacterium]|nr:hypothetical protein [Patescibacteria group bacterium]
MGDKIELVAAEVVVPAPPNEHSYPVSALELFKSYTWLEFVAKYGFVPPWDPSKPIKPWIDPNVDTTKATVTYGEYQMVAGQQKPQKVPVTYTPLEALTYNIMPYWPQPRGVNPPQAPTPHRDLASFEEWSLWCGWAGIIINRTDM